MNPLALVAVIAFGALCTLGGGLLMNYSKERSFAQAALQHEKAAIQKEAVLEYKEQLLSDEYGSSLIALQIENVKLHSKNWHEPKKHIEQLNKQLKARRKNEKAKR